MTHLPDLERLLHDAVTRAEQPTPTPMPTSRSGWPRLRIPALAAVGTLAIAGGAVAATGLLDNGDPAPRTAQAFGSLGKVDAGSPQLLPVTAPDPDGGPQWGVRVFQTDDNEQTCAQVGRTQAGQLGVIGADGTFNNDGKFHPLDPTSLSTGACGAVTGADGGLRTGSIQLPASGYSGSALSSIGGCAIPPRPQDPPLPDALSNVPKCAADSLRTIKYGFAGSNASTVTYTIGDTNQDATVRADTNGAYLFVLPATKDDTDGESLKVTYRDGKTCTFTDTSLKASATPCTE